MYCLRIILSAASVRIIRVHLPTRSQPCQFVFKKAIDAWIGFERTVLEKAVIDAGELFPEYVGMKLYELVECGFEIENRDIRDEHYLFFYQEDCVYIVDFGLVNGGTYIYEMSRDTDVYICSYSETWVRPW